MSATTFACPECGSSLKLAKLLPSGKRVKCPKCSHIFLPPVGQTKPAILPQEKLRPDVPLVQESEPESGGWELVQDQEDDKENRPQPRKNRPKTRAEHFDEEDDEGYREDDKARSRAKKRGRKKPSSSNTLLVLAIVLGGVVFLLVAAGGVGGLVWYLRSVRSADPKAFNDAIVGANLRLRQAGVELGMTMASLVQGQPADVAAVKKAYDNALKVLREVQADMKGLKIPSSVEAEEYYQQHQRMLANQEKIILTDLAEIVRIVEDDQTPPGDKRAKIIAIFVRVATTENADLAAVQAAQAKFAQKYRIVLLPPQ